MRVIQNPQLQLGEVDISKIQFDPKSRDEMPQVLRGLQHIYINRPLYEEITQLLEKYISPNASKTNGRPGMDLWKIFVMGVIRLNLNWDYDRLQDEVNNHATLRQMLGHADWYDKYYYQLQTIKDNVSLLTPELLDQINQIIVRAGHTLLKKKDGEALRGRCDSFVVETDVHFPTDINLLLDAMRKVIELTGRLSEAYERSDWRQWRYNINHLKRLMRAAQNKKRGKGRTEEQQQKRIQQIAQAHQDYIHVAQRYLDKARGTLKMLETSGLLTLMDSLMIDRIEQFAVHADRQINQIDRRVLKGEEIPHHEKVFSIFEPHTEWISKGKAGVPVELGLRVCVLEDQHQFVLHHHVMEKETDDMIASKMVKETQKKFPDLRVASFDKGFHSKTNQEELSECLDLLALPRKGKLSKQAQAIESSDAFRKARRKHSGVESCINALEQHGLDRCLDHGIQGFKNYVALSIVARNIQRIGAILQKRAYEQLERRQKKYCSRDGTLKLAA